MRYVLDCSVALKWSLPEPLTSEATQLLHQYRVGSLELVAPDLIVPEFGHGLRKKVLGGTLSRSDGEQVWADFLGLAIPTTPSQHLAPTALGLALDHMATVYDAFYVALASQEESSVITADAAMARAFQALGRVVLLEDFARRL